MAQLFKIFLGAAVVAVIGILSIQMDVLPGSKAAVEKRLQARAQSALDETAAWAAVTVDGQKAMVSGEAPSLEAREEAAALVAKASWGGGLIFGGVTAVDVSGVTVSVGPPVADPFIWVAERQGNEILLSGNVPSQEARDAVYQLTAMRFSEYAISGELEIAGGAPSEEDWLHAASLGLQALTRLASGAVEADGARFRISGVAEDATRITVIEQVMGSLPEGFDGVVDVTVAAPPPATTEDEAPALTEDAPQSLPPTPTPLDEAEETTLAQNNDVQDLADECRNRLREAIEAGVISFPRGQRYVDDSSRAYMREIANQLSVCPQFALEIIGHTDSSGNERRNRQLSLNRADNVAAYLRSVGVEASRLETRGAGSSEPVADNADEAGRARNRRIEFTIIFDPPE